MTKYTKIASFVYDCKLCPTPCDGQSKLNYQFEQDAQFSEYYEQQLIRFINNHTPYSAAKTTNHHYPDVEVWNKKGQKFYIEVKVQRRTFMRIEQTIPSAKLKPSETVALNLSDLMRYFDIMEKEKVPVFLFWVVMNRPCVLGEEKAGYFYRLADDLKKIWEAEKDNRRFRRKSGHGDEVDGKHLGVTVNYHFSLNELIRWENEKFF
jgi:hypothetical protein